MYTRLSAHKLAVLHGIYPKPHKHEGGKPVVWVRGMPSFFRSEDIAIFWCWCGKYGFVSRSKIEDMLDPKCTMRPWVKDQKA
jgi:hypothetical protein